MKNIVYIETTIPSFFFEVRSEPDMIARRNWTREWWNMYRSYYQLVTSLAVIEELERGEYPNKENIIGLLEDVPILTTPIEIVDIVGYLYITSSNAC